MTLQLWAVRASERREVLVAAAHTRLAARLRVSEATRVPLSRLAADAERDEQPPRRRFRCGKVGAEVLWSRRVRQWFACVVAAGRRRYVSVGGAGWSDADATSLEALRTAARSAVSSLLDADELDESLVVWETQTLLHVAEEV